ncbi:hypothetical protein RHORCCE3_0177 [Rickettsia hoogstraalii str. RCCE3]|nr:hypothetical protein RHORCCE3_0177 [Rickettsia hoogstraalii str. RCCE3]
MIKECETYENFKKILDAFSDKIARIIQFKDELVSKLLDWGKNFEDNVDILTNEIEKLLNPSLKDVLPKKVFF